MITLHSFWGVGMLISLQLFHKISPVLLLPAFGDKLVAGVMESMTIQDKA
jgi:hypothetical protein